MHLIHLSERSEDGRDAVSDNEPESKGRRRRGVDEHDQGGFGHTPWGVGIQNRYPQPHVPSQEAMNMFAGHGETRRKESQSAMHRIREAVRRLLGSRSA